MELVQHLETAFAAGPVTSAGLLDAATVSAARPAVLAVLEQLPKRSYGTIRDLWYELPDLPVG
ncbi:DUF2795 domain-containing protein [Actinoplanes derwentensis]|nr:DUF2795 domain-containing protein [Actinoplanes derwentensis]